MVRWENIIDGHSGFEQLATKYVKSEFQFPYGGWKATQETHDGNKDAYTVILGYHPYVDQNEMWWMEAKYSSSEKQKYVTRFRLDATIVSSIFNKKVSKIIFVTNIDIHAKTISDIRVALQKAIGCKEVYFSTKQVLEYWLLQNPSIFQKFFTDPPPSIDTARALFVSEEISVYPDPSDTGYIEKCTHIYIGKTYQAYFKIISTEPQNVLLTSAQKGIEIEEQTIQLFCGETAIHIPFRLTEQFQICPIGEDGRESRRLDMFQIHKDCPVLLKSSIDILQSTDFHLIIQSQTDALSKLSNDVQHFRRDFTMRLIMLHGESGVGKSHLVHQFMSDPSMKTEYLYYYNFSEDSVENAKHILYLIFFLLLPYINPDEIDLDYMRAIGAFTVMTRDIVELTAFHSRPQNLEEAFSRYCEKRGSILPERCELNTRYIFMDNIQNLSAPSWNFLLSVLREVKQKGCPFFFLLVGQNHILESYSYRSLKQMCAVAEYECKLDSYDIVKNIKSITSFDLSRYVEIVSDYFPNLIVMLSFLRFIRTSMVSELHDLNDFLTQYIAFVNGGMCESLVLDQFANIKADDHLWKLCLAIYTAPNGIAIESGNHAAASALLQSGLVKFNSQNRLIPFHDIYEGIFRKTNQISKRTLGLAYTDEMDEARDRILFPDPQYDLVPVAEQITKLRKAGHFYSVCYILDSFFDRPQSNPSGILLKNPLNSDVYYQMYFDYAYASVNCSHRRTGYDCFEAIFLEIESKTSMNMRLLKMELLFELMNSNYNIFNFCEAMQRYRQFQETMGLLIRSGQLPPCRTKNEMFVLCENMRILIQSARGKKRSEKMFLRWRDILKDAPYQHHYIDFHIRYAHTLYTIDPRRALQYTEEANLCLSEEGSGTSKLWCLVKFQYLYLQLILRRDYTLLPELEAVTEAAKKNYYSSYRYRNLAFCAILYVIGDIQKADERFLRDMAHPRQLRDKLKGFYFETLAMHHLAHNDLPLAITALEQAAETFRNTPDYLRTIRHNQKVLKRASFSLKRMDYNFGNALKPDWYYIDPRAD